MRPVAAPAPRARAADRQRRDRRREARAAKAGDLALAVPMRKVEDVHLGAGEQARDGLDAVRARRQPRPARRVRSSSRMRSPPSATAGSPTAPATGTPAASRSCAPCSAHDAGLPPVVAARRHAPSRSRVEGVDRVGIAVQRLREHDLGSRALEERAEPLVFTHKRYGVGLRSPAVALHNAQAATLGRRTSTRRRGSVIERQP